MKKTFILIASFCFVVLFAQTAANLTEFKENIETQKVEAKDALKPYRYDGSKVTYFNFKTYKQTKEVEVYLFNNTDYRFSFNGKSLPNDITVQIYDEDVTITDRIMLKEFSGVMGKNVVVETTDLQKAYDTKKPNGGRLIRIYFS